MLYHYLEYKRKESSPQLHATYLVSGKLEDKGQMCHKVSVVREDQLEDFKSKMSLVVSVHVYSIQKALLKDSGPLYSVDYDAVKDNLKNCSRYSAIRCARAVPMSAVELQQVQEIQQAPPSAPENKKSTMNGDANMASKPSTRAQKGIMGMFANKSAPKSQDNSKEVKPEPKEESPVPEAPKSKPAAKSSAMANFFGVQTKKPEKPVEKQQEAQLAIASEQQHQRTTAEEPAAVQLHKETKTDSRSKTKRMEESDSEEEKMEKKKRRRIKKPQPDSSDEDVIPDSPPQVKTSPKKEPETIQHSQTSSGTKTRRRRKVLKSHTFMDEEGCIVTEKDYVSESYSETDDDFQSTKPAPRNNNKAKVTSSSKDDDKKTQKKSSTSSNKGSKQASIMGFFQKK
ncbi:DNA polymerase delta subunit 3 isoform X2 [Poeciliopsis prolifica]|nr:DNA polymerase delta subunit 3 isoform X2 [Poeciliopsis prolifica]XP_054881300.1 DNA polymerase delta subunit 3 isoform X2 [Poeciliopsis prolifica]XP_054881301.1 DNA polymerase delta subunit 3 isoform X2 [Poeciliopsis prolifica]